MRGGTLQNFIYVLKCPSSGEIRYVGKTDNPKRRLNRHIRDSARGSSDYRSRWIRTLLASGSKPIMEIVRTLEPHEDWQEAEIAEIKIHRERGCRLTNCTDGGDGAALIDPERIAWRNYRAREALKDPKVKQKIAEGIAAHWAGNTVARKEMSEKQKAIGSTPIERAIRSARMRRLWEQDKERMLASQSTAEFRKGHSERIAKAWADPAIRSKMDEVNRNPESRKKKSEGAKHRWSDPVNRARAVEKAKARATPEYRAMMAEKTRLSWEKRRANAELKKLAQQETGE